MDTKATATDIQPPTLRLHCRQSSTLPTPAGLWGPSIDCLLDPSTFDQRTVGTVRRLVRLDQLPALTERLRCQLVAKHSTRPHSFDAAYECTQHPDDRLDECRRNTSAWLSGVFSPVAEFDVRVPNIASLVDLSPWQCRAFAQTLSCADLPANRSMFETSAGERAQFNSEPLQCLLSFTAAMTDAPMDESISALPTSAALVPTGASLVLDTAYDWWFLCVVLFIVAGAVGNVLVCLAVTLDRRLQNVTNYFLFSLAIADLLVSLVVMPLGAIPSFIGFWPMNLQWCSVYVTCDVLACSSSILHMCFISVGRYAGIRNPLGARHSSTKRRTFVKITIVWAMALMVCSSISLLAFLDEHNIMPHAGKCTINNRAFFVFGSLVTFYVPMLVMVGTYAATIRLLSQKAKFVRLHPDSEKWHRSTTLKSASNRTTSFRDGQNPSDSAPFDEVRPLDRRRTCTDRSWSLNDDDADSDEDEDTSKERQSSNSNRFGRRKPDAPSNSGALAHPKRYKLKSLNFQFNNISRPAINLNIRFLSARSKGNVLSANALASEQKATKVLGIVFFTFVLCWSPFFVLNIVFAACPLCPIPDNLVNVCLWLGYVSSTINPIIYTIFNRTFRLAFIRLLRCDCKTYSTHVQRYRSVNEGRSAAVQGANSVERTASTVGCPGRGAAALVTTGPTPPAHLRSNNGASDHGHQQQRFIAVLTPPTPASTPPTSIESSDNAASGSKAPALDDDTTTTDAGLGMVTRRLSAIGNRYAITDDEC